MVSNLKAIWKPKIKNAPGRATGSTPSAHAFSVKQLSYDCFAKLGVLAKQASAEKVSQEMQEMCMICMIVCM